MALQRTTRSPGMRVGGPRVFREFSPVRVLVRPIRRSRKHDVESQVGEFSRSMELTTWANTLCILLSTLHFLEIFKNTAELMVYSVVGAL